jgi:ubiquinone/menaquinone biosynthesis C-methylase UbiE
MKLAGAKTAYKHLIRIIKKYNNKSSLNILDYGCGLNTYLFEIACKNNIYKCYGIDINNNFIEINKKIAEHNNIKNIFFENNTKPYKTSFLSNNFDVVILGSVIEHTNRPKELIKECRRVLRPNGIIIITTPYIFHKKFFRLTNILKTGITPKDHAVEGYAFESLRGLLDGFEILEEKYIIIFFFSLMHEIMSILTYLYKKINKISIYDSIFESFDVKLEYKKGFKYYFAESLGNLFYLTWMMDSIIHLKGYEIEMIAQKVNKNDRQKCIFS